MGVAGGQNLLQILVTDRRFNLFEGKHDEV